MSSSVSFSFALTTRSSPMMSTPGGGIGKVSACALTVSKAMHDNNAPLFLRWANRHARRPAAIAGRSRSAAIGELLHLSPEHAIRQQSVGDHQWQHDARADEDKAQRLGRG